MLLLVCLSLLGYCFTFTRLSKQSIEFAPFFVVSTGITLLYFFAYINILEISTNIMLITGDLLFIILFFFFKSEKAQLYEKYFTPGFIIPTCFIILFSLMAYHVHLSNWDEFTHWGPHDKLVYLNNGFINAADVTINKSYPLGGSLFHYLFFRASGFSEGNAYVAQCILMMAPLSILFRGFNWSSWKTATLFFVLTLLILLLLHVKIGYIDTLYMDNAVGIFSGACIVTYLLSQKKISVFFYLIPCVIALTLFKPKTYPFVMMIAGVFFITELLILPKSRKTIQNCLAALLLPIISIMVTKTWYAHLKTVNTVAARQMHITIAKLQHAFFAPSGSVFHTIITNYLQALPKSLLFLSIIFLITLFTYLRYRTSEDKKSLVIINITLFFGFIAFVIALLLMYLFNFSTYEAIEHASMQRYLSIYYVAWALVTLHFIIDAFRKHKIKSKSVENVSLLIMVCALISVIFIYYIQQHHLAREHRTTWQLRQPIAKIADAVKNVTKQNSSIFTIWQDTTGFERGVLIYELTPRKPNLGCASAGKPYTSGDVWTCNISSKKLETQMNGFNYLLLAYTDKNFWSHYGALIPNHKKLKPLVTYSICHGNYFNSFGKKNCQMKTYSAYLFRIITHNGKIKFINISGKEK